MKKSKFFVLTLVLVLGLFAVTGQGFAAGFQEYPIGDEQEVDDAKINVAVVYFQPVPMEPAGMSLAPDKADIHLEADISAVEGNETGLGVGEWVPNLTVHYKMVKKGTNQVIEGTFMPMSASDGPHYGSNVKLAGAGSYDLTLTIESPLKQNYLVHTDKETGVSGRFWQKPIVLHWVFDYVPRKW